MVARTHTTSIYFFSDNGCMCPCLLQSERQASTILPVLFIFFQPNKHSFCFSNETHVPVHLGLHACYLTCMLETHVHLGLHACYLPCMLETHTRAEQSRTQTRLMPRDKPRHVRTQTKNGLTQTQKKQTYIDFMRLSSRVLR